jgi:hypothetical protein
MFRKKPVVIEAYRWPGGSLTATPIINWILAFGGTARYHSSTSRLAIDTLEGTMVASPGDWIIRGVHKEFYPCKPDIFDETYEPEGVNGGTT